MLEQRTRIAWVVDRFNYRLDEAMFFYDKMVSTSESVEADYYFHACTTALYSVYRFILDECESKNKIDLLNEVSSNDDCKFFFKRGAIRGKDVHEFPQSLSIVQSSGDEDNSKNGVFYFVDGENVPFIRDVLGKDEIKSSLKRVIELFKGISEKLKN